MRRIKVKKQRILNEAGQQSQSKGIKIEYQESDNSNMAQMFHAAITDAYARDLANATNVVEVKLTKNLQADISFPKAPTQIESLFLPAQMPKKFTNVYSSYDADPLATIEQCQDLAVKYFTKLDNVQESSAKPTQPEKPDKDPEVEEPAGQEAPAQPASAQPVPEQPADASAQPVDNGNSDFVPAQPDFINDSVVYKYAKSLNEAGTSAMMATAAGAGLKTGSAITTGCAGIGSFLTGLLAGLSPTLLTANLLGRAAGSHGEHANTITDDRELMQQFNEQVKDPKSLQTFIGSAIDSYIKDLLGLYEQGLRHITSNSKSSDIAKLNKLIINFMVARSPKYVDEFVKDNNSMLKEILKIKTDKVQAQFTAQSEFIKRIQMMMADSKFRDLGVRMEAISAYINSRGKNAGNYKDDFAKITQYMSGVSTKGHEYDDELTDSVSYTGNPLNEADNNEPQLPKFDADAMYDNIEASIESAVQDILSSNTEDWALVQTARKQMVAMRDAATKEITTSIEHVCRMANGDQSGLSSRLTSFISKHPLRAAKLTNLWARHEADLNARIEQRIKQISELDGKGPLMMANQLYTKVMPKLFAMLLTYKTLLNFYTDERFKVPGTIIAEAVSEDKLNEIIQGYKNVYASQIAYAFSQGCTKLTSDGTAPFNMDTGFTGVDMPYLVPWLMCLLGDTNEMESADIKRMGDIIRILTDASSSNNYNKFFSALSDYICKECKCKHHDAAIAKISESWSLFEPKKFEEFISDIEANPDTYMNLPKTPANAIYVFMHVIKSKGMILDTYAEKSQTLAGYLNKDVTDKNTRAQLFQVLELDPSKDEEAYSMAERLFNKATPYLQTINNQGQPDIVQAIRAYYALNLHKMAESASMFPLSRLKAYKDMCNNPVIKQLMGNDAVIEEYAIIQKIHQEKTASLENFNKYLGFITDDKAQLVQLLNFKDSGINTDEQFNSAVVPTLDAYDKAENITGTFMQAPALKAVGWQYQEVTMDDVYKKIFPNSKVKNVKNLREFLSYPEEQLRNFNVIPEAGDYIKQLLCLEAYVLLEYVKQHRNSEQEVKDLWDTECIPRGKSNVPLSVICGFISGLYSMAGDKAKKKIEKIIANLDSGLTQYLNTNCQTTLAPGLFTDFMVKNQVLFKNSMEFAAHVEKYITDNAQGIDSETEKKCLSAVAKYMLNPNDFKSAESFYMLYSNRTRTSQSVTDEAALESLGLYFGTRKFRILNEKVEQPDSKYLEWLNSPEGISWLTSLCDGTAETQENNQNNSTETAVSQEAAEAAAKLQGAAKQVSDKTENPA